LHSRGGLRSFVTRALKGKQWQRNGLEGRPQRKGVKEKGRKGFELMGVVGTINRTKTKDPSRKRGEANGKGD